MKSCWPQVKAGSGWTTVVLWFQLNAVETMLAEKNDSCRDKDKDKDNYKQVDSGRDKDNDKHKQMEIMVLC